MKYRVRKKGEGKFESKTCNVHNVQKFLVSLDFDVVVFVVVDVAVVDGVFVVVVVCFLIDTHYPFIYTKTNKQ